jgi:colicin import membrane protein
MKVTTETENSQGLSNEITISVVIHVAVFLFFTLRAVFFPSEASIFESAIRVDMVDMPDKITAQANAQTAEVKPEPKAAEPPPPEPKAPALPMKEPEATKPVVKESTKEPDAIKLQKESTVPKETQKQALAKLKQMDAFEKLQKKIDDDKKQQALKAASQMAAKGNILSPGSELRGIDQLQSENYRGLVQKHMKQNWEVPHYIKKSNLITEVLVKFDSQGNILTKEVVKSSGNSNYDEAVLAAITKSSPVPAPPGRFSAIASIEGFTFVFKPEE